MGDGVNQVGDSEKNSVRAFYAANVSRFIEHSSESILGALAARSAREFRGNEPQQLEAWQGQIDILRAALAQIPAASEWGLLLEYPLQRVGRRPDAVLLCPGLIVVVEFKMGAKEHGGSYCQQVEDYALCIRDFHGAASGFSIIPILCAENAPCEGTPKLRIIDGVGPVVCTNAIDLSSALRAVYSAAPANSPLLSWETFDRAGYNPTPSIVEAARSIYAGHSVDEIGRMDADGLALQQAAGRLRHWVQEARSKEQHVVCLVDGTPGAGKTLLGLNLILSDGVGRLAGEPAVMLTGNRPLVQVLKGALQTDAKTKGGKSHVGRALSGALQTLLDYLKEHAATDAAPPPERVVVFDEAQRAWDEETGMKRLQRRNSEPELFLEILGRLPWACLVCLVGPGQEINRGEGGMRLWGAALDREQKSGRRWRVVAPTRETLSTSQQIDIDPTLFLSSGVRAYRNPRYSEWVGMVLSAEVGRATSAAKSMPIPPSFITRDLHVLKDWLRSMGRGGRRSGMLVSSGADRMVAEGVPSPPMSNDLKKIEHWFLKTWPDYRGSDALETPLCEFGCQGLELDYVGLLWGGDLIWSNTLARWIPRRLSAPKWQNYKSVDRAQHRINAYRVLLTRAREGICIFVPMGDSNDPTRLPSELDATAAILGEAGCVSIDSRAKLASS